MASAAALLAATVAVGQSACPGEGSCFNPNGSPGCDDTSCCIAICADDIFCCDVEWDSICANSAQALCAPACPSDCTGDLNDDGVVDGADLGLLLNNWNGAGCGDLNNDGVVDGADLGLLLTSWGPCAAGCGDASAGSCCEANGSPFCDDADCCTLICADDPFCCNSLWDSICASAAIEACAPCFECGSSGAGSCCEANGTPYCDDADCCALVCDLDPFCCNTEWDSICASQAQESCEECLACGNNFAGSCCEANGTPFCDDADCCAAVCAEDPFCCETEWDSICASQAQEICEGCPACGNDFAGSCCEANGTPFCDDADCCAAVCAADPFCCETEWDGLCVSGANNLCSLCGPPACAHSLCETGVALDAACDPCVAAICAVDPFCCNNSWDGVCINQVASVCGLADCIGANCAHSPCVTGEALNSGCDSCVASICKADPFCCDSSWDGLCVGQVDSVCGLTCP